VASRRVENTAKKAAIAQWTADPCGPETSSEPGTPSYAEQLVAGRRTYAPWFAEALDYAGAGGLRVLDVGCGQGIDLIEYARAGAEVTGVDLTLRHLELARQNLDALHLDAKVVDGDAEELPFADGSFDRVSSNGVLHHTPDIARALQEIRRVLRPSGEVRVLVYNRNSLHYWLFQVLWQGIRHGQLLEERSMAGVLSRGVEQSSIGARPLVRVYTPAQVRRFLKRAGFVDVTSAVGVFKSADTPLSDVLARRTRLLDNPARVERLGRVAGWYVLGFGRRPLDRPGDV
jgi:ubiquinone/menaquinone biosynthesis C-methylase UbiE